MLVKVSAELECDRCGARRVFDIDAAYKPPAGWSVFDLALDVTRWCGAGCVTADGGWICSECDEPARKAEGAR